MKRKQNNAKSGIAFVFVRGLLLLLSLLLRAMCHSLMKNAFFTLLGNPFTP